MHIKYLIKLLLVEWLLHFCFYSAIAQNTAKEIQYPFPLDKNEKVIYLKKDNDSHIAFLVKFNSKPKYTRLKAVQFNPASKKLLTAVVIDSAKIGNWQNSPFKGNVRQSFDNAVTSGKPQNEQIPLEYQYQVSISPDNKTILCYRYDYSQPTLYIQALVLNSNLEKHPPFQMPIDEGLINQCVFVNNEQDVFLLHTDSQDGILLMRYQPDTDHSTLLEVAASSTRRHSFLPYIASKETIYIANVTEHADNLSGIMYTRFNFASERVEEVQYRVLSKDMQEKVNTSSTKGRYQLVNFTITSQGHFLLELQKQNIEATGYIYDPYAVNDINLWRPRKSLVTSGEKILFEFDSDGKLVLEKFIL